MADGLICCHWLYEDFYKFGNLSVWDDYEGMRKVLDLKCAVLTFFWQKPCILINQICTLFIF